MNRRTMKERKHLADMLALDEDAIEQAKEKEVVTPEEVVTKEKRVRVVVSIPPDILAQFKEEATRLGMSRSMFIVHAEIQFMRAKKEERSNPQKLRVMK